jgi:hypothetical protein
VDEDRVEELWRMVGGRDEAVTRQQVLALATRVRRAQEELRGDAPSSEQSNAKSEGRDEEDKNEGTERLANWFTRHGLGELLSAEGGPNDVHGS